MRPKAMTKMLLALLSALLLAGLLTAASYAAYPSSGTDIPDGSTFLSGEIIGEKNGWDGSPGTGASAAFDGNPYSYYDPTSQANPDAYCGMDLGSRFILTKVMILPRESQLGRYEGALIQGSDDMDDWVTLFVSTQGSSSFDWKEITDFDDNVGYRYYRYWNTQNHGDVAEVEFYGRPADGTYTGPIQLSGEVIGERTGWDGSEGTGASAAFDGDRRTYYDPTTRSAEYAFTGLDLGQPYILSKVRVLPREGWLDRFRGASIQGSNDMEEWETLYTSSSSASSWDWQVITDFDNNVGYRYYRYWNGQEHGDVGELQFYGYPMDGSYTPPTPATLAVPAGEVTVRFDILRTTIDSDAAPITVQPGLTYPSLPGNPVSSFVGWYTLPKGGEEVKEGDTVTRLSDHTLYAHYSNDEQPADLAPAETEPAGPAAEPVADANEPAEAADAAAETEPAASPVNTEAEKGFLRPVPLICIAVCAAALITMFVVMAKHKE